MNLPKLILKLMLFLVICVNIANSAYLQNVPMDLTQPNGRELKCFASGDEYYNWLHDKEGYTIIQNVDDGYYYYADLINDNIVPTIYLAGTINPSEVGLKPWVMLPEYKLRDLRNKSTMPKSMAPPAGKDQNNLQSVLNIGSINNVVVYIRFSDETEFTDSYSTYYNVFNAPTGNSMKNYFKEMTYNKLDITSVMYPEQNGNTIVSYQHSIPRAFYRPYNATTNPTGYKNDDERTVREMDLLRDAVGAIESQVPDNQVVDADNDGYVDNVVFVVKGGPDAWASLLWPHAWVLYYHDVRINGKRVWRFNLNLQTMLSNSVICHEMNHTLGAPDLYRYYVSGTPVGSWDLMAQNSNPPQHTSAYMKMKYGLWIDNIPEITSSGMYSLNPLVNPTNNAFMVKDPNKPNEFYVMEYRKKEGAFEIGLPASGLLIYRINPQYDGNADGPPDEIYIYRPGGTPSSWGNINTANFSNLVGRTKFSKKTTPYPFWTDGTNGNLNITNIEEKDGKVYFRVNFTPKVPTLIFPENNSAGITLNPTFKWNNALDADKYFIQISEDNTFTTILYQDSTLTNNQLIYPGSFTYLKTYYWRVKSLSNYEDESAWSETWKFNATPEKPVIVNQKKSDIVCYDEDVQLHVSAVGSVIQYQWFRDNVAINGATRELLDRNDVRFTESAVYTCKLTNNPGHDTVISQPIAIYVATSTNFVRHPLTTYTGDGSTLTFDFDIHVNGKPDDYYTDVQWYKDGNKMVDDDRIAGSKSGMLSIRKIKADDYDKTYTVTVTGRCGMTVTSKPFTIKRVPTGIIENKNQMTCFGLDVDLITDFPFTAPEGHFLVYKWFGNGEFIDESRYENIHSKSLRIKNFHEGDIDVYSMKVYLMPENIEIGQTNVTLEVWDKVEITKQPEAIVNLTSGKELKLEIIASGWGQLEYQWFKEGIGAIPGANQSTYTKSNCTPADNGTYFCEVSNVCGKLQSENSNVTITIQQATEVEDNLNIIKDLKIMPNPSNGLSALVFNSNTNDECDVIVSDVLGNQIVNLGRIKVNMGTNNLTIDLTKFNINSGSYYLTMNGKYIHNTVKMNLIK